MPLWRVYPTTHALNYEQRAALATSITSFYTKGVKVPAFYVGVFFIELERDMVFIGGKATGRPFVRLVVEHIEKLMPDAIEEAGVLYRKSFMQRINTMLSPHLNTVEGLRWEIHFTQAPTDLWLVQGYVPPEHGSVEEKKWIEADAAIQC